MPPEVAAVIYGLGILGLFFFNRDQDSPTSKALWLPVIWLLIIGSRPVSQWLNIAPTTNSPDQYLDGSPLDRAVFAVLLIVGLIVLFTRARRAGMLLRSNWPIVLFFLYCGISTAWSDYPDVAFRRWVKALGDLVMVSVVLTDLDPLVAVKRLLSRVSFVLLPISILLIKYYPDLGRSYTPAFGNWQQMYTGVTPSKNSLGGLALIFGLAAIWEGIELFRKKTASHRGRRALIQGTILAMVSWIFWTANSATSLSCLLLGATLIVLTSLGPHLRRPLFVHGLILALLCASFVTVFIAPQILSMLGRDPTLTGRTQIWAVVLDMPINRIVGTGFESFWLGPRLQQIWTIWWWHPNEAHNGYIEVLLNLGWVGIFLLGMLLVTGYRNIVSQLCRNVSFARLALAYFLMAMIYSFTEAGFRSLGLTWIFLLLAITTARVPFPEIQPEAVPQFGEAGANEVALGADPWGDAEPEVS
jgi:exopolysaccharide production protein ExoQ